MNERCNNVLCQLIGSHTPTCMAMKKTNQQDIAGAIRIREQDIAGAIRIREQDYKSVCHHCGLLSTKPIENQCPLCEIPMRAIPGNLFDPVIRTEHLNYNLSKGTWTDGSVNVWDNKSGLKIGVMYLCETQYVFSPDDNECDTILTAAQLRDIAVFLDVLQAKWRGSGSQ